VTPKVYKAAEVCELVQVQPYVLRSWEKEFPGIGVQKSPESPRLYRQSDLEQVQRIKQLVFVEGLTVSGARRRLEESMPVMSVAAAKDTAEVLDTLAADARTRIATVRDGLREIHSMLGGSPGTSNGTSRPTPTPARVLKAVEKREVRKELRVKQRPVKAARAKAVAPASRTKPAARASSAKPAAVRKKTAAKRKRA
jgi:DNA-binding transcriptional MerR regulator